MAVFNKDQLPEVITPNTIEYVMVFDKGSSEPRKVLKTKFDELYASSGTNGGPKEYIALLTQAGTHAPTTVVIKNTLGGTPVWSYVGFGGNYALTLASTFPLDKTVILMGNTSNSAADSISSNWTDVNSITVRTEVNDVSANDLLTNTVIHITVYP